MSDLVSRWVYGLGSGADPALRDLAALIGCAALYWAFLRRERRDTTRPARRGMRCPDSILRG